jgi:uncharacterized protein YqgC (DUF456 family)
MTNKNLPVLSPLKARSTVAALLTVVGAVSPLLGGGVGLLAADFVANGDAIQSGAQTTVEAINALVTVVGMAWLWIERRAPSYRLSLKPER